MNIEIHDPVIKARLQKQVESTASHSLDEALLRLLEMQEDQDRWIAENQLAINEKIRNGIEQLDRGEGVPERSPCRLSRFSTGGVT